MSEDDKSPDPEDSGPGNGADVGEGNGNGHRTQDIPDDEDTPSGIELPDLAQTLLASEIATDDKPGRRWAYPLWGMVIVTAFILYHATVLFVHNLPNKGIAKGSHAWFDKHFDMGAYLRATGNTQSWAMFAPNPHRSNIFMKVEVVDAKGELWDLKHDIYGKRTYPYLWYSRMGKVNRRIVDQKGYRRHYAAWVCRMWELEHDELPEEVRFTKLWTKIPTPEQLWKATKGRPWLGYDPMELHLSQREEDSVRCSSTRHAQLPNAVRARHGMEPMPEGHFRGLHIRTWVDMKEDQEENEDRLRRKRK